MARAFSSSRRPPPKQRVEALRSTASSSTGVWMRLREPLGSSLHEAAVDRVLHRGDDELEAELGRPSVSRYARIGEVEPGVHVHHGERDARRRERLARDVQHHDRVLAAAEQQAGPLHLGRDLAEDVDALRLEGCGAG